MSAGFQILIALGFLVYGIFVIVTRFGRIGRGRGFRVTGVAAILFGASLLLVGLIWGLGAVMRFNSMDKFDLFGYSIHVYNLVPLGIFVAFPCFIMSMLIEWWLHRNENQ